MKSITLTVFTTTISWVVYAQAPTISSISAGNTYTTGSVTITGNNFNTTAANNLVFFGATRAATPTAASGTSLTVTVPEGATHDRITVTNTASGLTGRSQYAFFPQYIANTTTPAFSSSVTLTAITKPMDVAIGDIDGDGKADIVCTDDVNPGTPTISVFRNTSTTANVSFATKADYTLTGSNAFVSSVALGDVDGDGKLDMLATSNTGNFVAVFRNTSTSGSISFATAVNATTGGWPYESSVADIDGDGKADVIVVADLSDAVSVLRNTGSVGTISFATKVDISIAGSGGGFGFGPQGLSIADFDGDNKLDMVTGNILSNDISVMRNTSTSGSVSFATASRISSGSWSQNVASGDVDGDGKPDILSVNFNSNTFSVFRNTGSSGTISFAAKSDISTSTQPYYLSLGDITGDGKIDVIVSNYGATGFSVFRNTSTSGIVSFASPVSISTGAGTKPAGIVTGDLDNDGKPDITLADYNTNTGSTSLYSFRNITEGLNTWTGNSSTAWATGANWSWLHAPTGIDHAVIASVGTAPSLSSNTTVAALTCNSSSFLTISNGISLNVTGNFVSNGAVLGAGKITLNGASAQTITGTTGSVANLELNNSAGATITSSNFLNITNTYTPTNGILTTNGGLVLKSSLFSTARIAQGGTSGGYISGNVTIEKYVPGKRAYRFLGHPFSSSVGLSDLTDDIDITGNGGSANGFTTTLTNNPSAFWFDVSLADNSTTGNNPGWTAFTNTANSGANSWDQYELIRLFVRGTKGQGLSGGSYTASPVTMDLSGTINQGTQTITITKGTNSTFAACGNPFPSGVQMNALSKGSNIGPNYYVWNATVGVAGAYVTNAFTLSYILPAYSAFFTTVSANTNNTITFEEADKASGGAGLFKGTGNANWVELIIEDSNIHWDRLLINLDDNSLDAEDNMDAKKLYNPGLDFFTLSKDDVRLAIDVRPYNDGARIPLGLTAYDRYNRYVIKTGMFDIPAGTKLYLHDKYLNKSEELIAGFEYWFDITTDSNSQGAKRFEIFMQGNPESVLSMSSERAKVQLVPNPARNEVKVSFDKLEGAARIKVISIAGQVVYNNTACNRTSSVMIPLNDLAPGIYIVELQGDNVRFAGKLIKE